MPPKENKVNALALTSEQLALIKLWIDQGGRGEIRGASSVVWQALPDHLNPIFSVALSPDGQYAACGRGNQLFVYHLPTRRLAARLIDPHLNQVGLYTNANVAHLDFVHALAFSPGGDLLASGGYREVKLWRRVRHQPNSASAIGQTNTIEALAVSPDGKWVATGAVDGTIQILSANGESVKTIAGHDGAIRSLSFSADGTRLVSGALDRAIRVWDLATGKLHAQATGPAELSAVVWLGKRGQIASGGSAASIQLWQVPEAPGELTAIDPLKGHDGPITALHFAFGMEDQLVSGSRDGSVRIWNLETRETIRKLEHGGAVSSVAVRSDGKRIASAGENEVARLWDAETGKLIAELKGDGEAEQRVLQAERALAYANTQVSFCKTSIDKADQERKAQVERVRKATEANVVAEKSLAEKQKALADAKTSESAAEKAFSEIGAQLKKAQDDLAAAEAVSSQAKADANALINRWLQAQLGDQANHIKAALDRVVNEALAGPPAQPRPEPNAVIATNQAGAVPSGTGAVANAEAAKTSAALPAKASIENALDELAAKAHAAGLAKAAFERFKPEAEKKHKEADEKLKAAKKAASDADGALKKAELTRSTSENELLLAITAAQKAADALAEAHHSLQLAEIEKTQKETSLALGKNNAVEAQERIRALSFSPDGLLLATGGDDRQVHLWSAEDGRPFDTLAATGGTVTSIGFVRGNRLVSGAVEQGLQVWDLATDWRLERVIGSGDEKSAIVDRVNALHFAPDGKSLITGGGEPSRSGELKVWRISDGQLLQEIKEVHSDTVLGLDVTPDGKYLASSAADKFIRIIDLGTGKVVRSLEGHTHHVLSVSWMRDGRTLISGGADNVAKVWDAFAGERKKNIDGFNKEVTAICFVGDTDQAVVCSGDNSVRLVKQNGEKVRVFEGGTDFMASAAVTFDGKVVIAGGQESILRVWDGISGNLMASFAEKN
jgi:WD40 repeat protein